MRGSHAAAAERSTATEKSDSRPRREDERDVVHSHGKATLAFCLLFLLAEHIANSKGRDAPNGK